MKVIVIIPAYNEAENIVQVINDLQAATSEMDYIIINDSSQDNTAWLCKENNLCMVSLPINLGIGGGVQTGYLYALEHGYDIAVQMDGDGQHDPAYLCNIILPITNNEADVVIGSRFLDREGFQSSRMRRAGIKVLSTLIYLCTGTKVKDVTSGYRAVNRKFIEIYSHNYAQDFPEPEAIVAAAMHNARIKEVPVIMRERVSGTSSITSWKSVYYMLKVSLAVILYRITFHKERPIV